MRLAFFNSSRSWGGVKTWTVEFAAALQQMGHEVTIFGRKGPFVQRAAHAGLPAHEVSFGPDFNPAAIWRFASFFRRQGTQAVLVNVGRDIRTAGVAAALCGLPVVHRIGLPRDMRNHWKVRAVHRLVRPHYLCPCEFIRQGMLDALPFVDKKDSTVILSAKTPSPAPAALRRDSAAPLQLVTTSQLKSDKGHADVLHVLHALKADGHRFHWHVAGTGDKAGELKATAAALGLAGDITWHGFTQDIGSVLSLADVFVLPSLSEGLPNTLLEAMARGLVPVARNVGGIAEVWPHHGRQLLLPADSFRPALHKALADLTQSGTEQLNSLGAAAWTQCRTTFSMQTQAPRLEQFFNTLIHGNPASCVSS
ncbi:glycosyltransferase [Oleidesulfovibrio alaskensis]|jgi:glycosyltransferase involved in cell wall biosynthesis